MANFKKVPTKTFQISIHRRRLDKNAARIRIMISFVSELSFQRENKIFVCKISSHMQGRVKANFLNSELQLPSELSNSSIE